MTTLHLPAPPGYNFQAVLASHGWRRLAPFRYDDDSGALHRTHALPSGRVTVLTMAGSADGIAVQSDLALTEDEQAAVIRAVRQMLALDVDLTPFYDELRGIPRYAWVEPAGAGRLLTSPTVWEDLVKTLLTTNVSWQNTINMVARLVEYGDTAADGSHTFPTPAQVAAHSTDALKAHVRCGYRAPSLHKLATEVAAGTLDVEAWHDADLTAEALYKQVLGLHGFGAYAAGSVMRLLGYHDWLALDSVARAAYAARFNGGDKPNDADIEAFYAPFGRWRGLALWMDVLTT